MACYTPRAKERKPDPHEYSQEETQGGGRRGEEEESAIRLPGACDVTLL